MWSECILGEYQCRFRPIYSTAIRSNPNGTNILSELLAYADDVVISARSRAALLGAFESGARNVDLLVNNEKTIYVHPTRN